MDRRWNDEDSEKNGVFAPSFSQESCRVPRPLIGTSAIARGSVTYLSHESARHFLRAKRCSCLDSRDTNGESNLSLQTNVDLDASRVSRRKKGGRCFGGYGGVRISARSQNCLTTNFYLHAGGKASFALLRLYGGATYSSA